MRKIKSQKKERVVVEVMDSKKKALIIGICTAVILLFAILMVAESVSGGKLTIENNTSKNITSLRSYFINEDNDYQSANLYESAIAAGESFKGTLPDLSELAGKASSLEVKFTFEDDSEKTLNSGFFNSNFKGNLKISFEEDSQGDITIHVKASSGIFGATLNQTNDTFDYNEIMY